MVTIDSHALNFVLGGNAAAQQPPQAGAEGAGAAGAGAAGAGASAGAGAAAGGGMPDFSSFFQGLQGFLGGLTSLIQAIKGNAPAPQPQAQQ